MGSTVEGSQEYYTGLVDEVEIFNRALSQSEIQAIYGAGSAGKCRTCTPPPANMLSWWPGDGNTQDITGHRDAVLRDNATFGAGYVQQAFVLDGNGDFIEVPDDPALNFGTGDFTIDIWANFNTTDGELVVMEKWVQGFSKPSTGWTLSKLDGNSLLLAMADGSGPEVAVVSDPLSIPTGTWIHFAAKRAAGVVTLFMNGTQIAQGTSLLSLNSVSSLKFGHRGSITDTPGSEDDRGFYLNGRVDEVEVFNRALSQSEIAAIVNAGSAGKCKPSYSAQVQQPINADGTSVFTIKRGVVPVKFTLTQGGVATCNLPPATIVVTRTAGASPGTVNESTYSMAADSGSNFKISSCQYTYNLAAGSLGAGMYRVDIKINGNVVGSAVFQLK